MIVMGIDPSTKTGYVILRGAHMADGSTTASVCQYGEINFPKKRGMDRVQSIGRQIGDLIDEWSPDAVVIEGYAFANRHTLVTLVEIQTCIRLHLHEYSVKRDRQTWAECQPSMLKKFVTGKGTSKKDVVMLNVFKTWGFEGTDNEADAYGLAMLALYAGVPGITPALKHPQREAAQEWRIANARLFDGLTNGEDLG